MRHPRILNNLIFLFIFAVSASAQVNYTIYGAILADNVSPIGEVNYSAILKEDSNKFDEFLHELSEVDPDLLNSKEQLAYWINAYNAFTIKLIVDHWPVKSIKDISNGKPWDKKWIQLDNKTYSLNQIENDIIRPQFQDPRIHFAVNCAAKSCPPLLNVPFTGAQLDQQLDQQTRSFINHEGYNLLNKQAITISKIFEWYKSDFDNLIDFINKYAKIDIDSEAIIRYTTYDWTLNN